MGVNSSPKSAGYTRFHVSYEIFQRSFMFPQAVTLKTCRSTGNRLSTNQPGDQPEDDGKKAVLGTALITLITGAQAADTPLKTAHVNDYDMPYEEHGSGPPLILLHGSIAVSIVNELA